MMKKITFLIFIIIFPLTACTSVQVASVDATLDPAKEATQSVQLTLQALLSEIRGDESDLEETAIPKAVSLTPLPTHTPRPITDPTPTVSYDRGKNTINGSIYDPITEDLYNFPVITVTDVKVYYNFNQIGVGEGEIIAQIDISMHNPGSTPASYRSEFFQVFDANGLGHDLSNTFSDECEIEYYADVLPSGTLDGCLEFIIPEIGQKFDLVYSPYRYDRFGVGRFLKWEIKYPLPSFPRTISVQINTTDPLELKQNLSESLLFNLPRRIVGEMQYLGEVPIREIRVEGIFYNDKGQIVNEGEGLSWQDGVLPGEKIIYFFTTIDANDITRAELNFTAKAVDPFVIPDIYKEFEVLDFQLTSTDNGDYKMFGEVHNKGDRGVSGIGIYVIAYDRQGNIIGFDQGTAGYELETLDPGLSSPINGYMRIEHPDGLNAVDHFEFLYEAHGW